MAQKPDIRVLVGVEGDVGIDSGSGKLISDTLTKIAKNISGDSSKIPKVTFTINAEQTAKNITSQLSSIVKSIKVEPLDLSIRTNQSSIGCSNLNSKKNCWDGTFKQSIKDLTSKNVDLNPINNYYKELEKQSDSRP